MPVDFSYITENQLLPLFYAEVTSAQEPLSPNLKICLIGHMNKTGFAPGTANLNYPYLVTRQDATSLFGKGSMLEMMYQKARYNARWAEVWCIAIPEDTVSTQAAGSITVAHAGNANRTGLAGIFIAGRGVHVKVSAADTAAQIAGRLAAAINQAGLPLLATNTSGQPLVTLTCRWAGVTGNELLISFVGPAGRRSINKPEYTNGAYYFNIVQPSGGAGETQPPATFAALDTRNFDIFVFPFSSSATLDACQDFMDGAGGRWSPFKQQYGHMVTTKKGTLADLTAFGNARNDPHMTVLGVWKSIMPTWEWSAALASIMVTHWAAPPELSRPLQTLELRGMQVGSDDDDSFNPAERELLLEAGLTSFHVDDDTTCRIDRVRTLRKLNAFGDPDPSWSDAILMFQAQYFVKAMRAAITGAFPRCALADDDLGINGFTSPGLIKLVIMHEYERMAASGLVENSDLFAQYLIVERNLVDRNRVDVLMRPDFVNQLRVLAALVETHLELDPTDPLLQVAA